VPSTTGRLISTVTETSAAEMYLQSAAVSVQADAIDHFDFLASLKSLH
jgi:hypothetical protein